MCILHDIDFVIHFLYFTGYVCIKIVVKGVSTPNKTIKRTDLQYLKYSSSFDYLHYVQVCIDYILLRSNFLYTGGSRLSRTAVKPDSRLARIFVAKFFCIIKLIIIIG